MRISLAAPALLAAALAAGDARAQSSAGAESFDFLNLDANARAVAMGGAYTALSADSNALLYNPGGLGLVRAGEATFMHNQYAQDVGQQYIAAVLKRGLGFQFNYASLGAVPRTTVSQPAGTGSRLGVSDMSLGAGYGRRLAPGLALGAGVKYLQESLGDATAKGYAADLGAMYRLPDIRGVTLGASLLNAGPAVKFAAREEKLPTTARLGAAYELQFPRRRLTLALDASKSPLDKARWGAGAEAEIQEQFSVRAGFSTRSDAGLGLSVGLGWRSRKLSADYAFVPLGELGSAHRVSLTMRWGQSDDPAEAARPGDAPAKGSLEARLAQAETALSRGDLVAAKSFLIVGMRTLPAGDRRRVRFHERIGSILFLQKDYAGAMAAYTQGVELAFKDGYSDQSVADAYIGIGMCHVAGKNYADARSSFQKGLSLGPSQAAVQMARAQMKASREGTPSRD